MKKVTLQDKQSMLNRLEAIKIVVLLLDAPQEEIDVVLNMINNAKEYFDDCFFEAVETIKELMLEIKALEDGDKKDEKNIQGNWI